MQIGLERFHRLSHSLAARERKFLNERPGRRHVCNHYLLLGILHIFQVFFQCLVKLPFTYRIWADVRAAASEKADIADNNRILLQVLYLVFFSKKPRGLRRIVVAWDENNFKAFFPEWAYEAFPVHVEECQVSSNHDQ